MAKTWWSVGTAAALMVGTLAVLAVRWLYVGPTLDRPRGLSSWDITLDAEGQLKAGETTLTTARPPNFRLQHIENETFQGDGLAPKRGKSKQDNRSSSTWTRATPGGVLKFHLHYRFRAVLSSHRPTNAMADLTRRLDAAPGPGDQLSPTARVESDSKEIAQRAVLAVAERKVEQGRELDPLEKARALFDYVDALDDRPGERLTSALGCLRASGGQLLSRCRLLLALYRSQGVPARLITGLMLNAAETHPDPHYWVEIWARDRWLPMCLAAHVSDDRAFPKNYLTLRIGTSRLLRGTLVETPGGLSPVRFTVKMLSGPGESDPASSWSVRGLFRRFSLYNLRPEEQRLARFLLLLPLAALVVSVCRTLIGLKTYGTFGPALLGLAFLDLRALPWGMGIFLGVVIIGWLLRRFIDRFHLLLVPRTAILLTLIVSVLLVLVVLLNQAAFWATHYISLFPLVILTHLVERFWTVEAEDGTPAAFRTLMGTLAVSASISVLLNPEPLINAGLKFFTARRVWPEPVATWMLGHPETLGLVLAVQFLIGRYSGYRLSELYRFQDLIEEPPAKGGKP